MAHHAIQGHVPSPDGDNTLKDQVLGCWLGKSIGGTLGLPAEGRTERLHYYFYEPVPTAAPPNDDLELQLVWLHLVENAGSTLTAADFGEAWRRHIHYMWDEYGRCRWNLRRGVPTAAVGTFENPFQSSMGSPIRSEFWACLFPGDPDSAAHYAAVDASLDHGVEGIAGEVLFAALQSETLGGRSLDDALARALAYLPGGCETTRAVRLVLQGQREGSGEWECWRELVARHGSENFTHAPLNVALTIWALNYGGGDFEKSILLAVNGGYDTDCTAATVGATLGLASGADRIPARWRAPIGEGVLIGPGILGISAPTTLSELTKRTVDLVGKLDRREWDGTIWNRCSPEVRLEELAGTIQISPLDGSAPVGWANGELPPGAKQAGGASWTWEVPHNAPREVVCLARAGARFYLNGALMLECPAGLPYVPATHRSPKGSRVRLQPGPGTHRVRVELASDDPHQNATVILAYPNFHLCPWTLIELPDEARLPSVCEAAWG